MDAVTDFNQQSLQSQTQPQTDAQIETWLQDILQPIPNSPTTTQAFALPAPLTSSSQAPPAEPEIIQLNPPTDLSWTMKDEDEMEQLLKLLPAPSDTFDGVIGDIPWVSEGLASF